MKVSHFVISAAMLVYSFGALATGSSSLPSSESTPPVASNERAAEPRGSSPGASGAPPEGASAGASTEEKAQ